MDSWAAIALPEPVPRMDIFLAAFDDIPDPRADNARYDLCELLVMGFVAVLCGATSCAGIADFGRAAVRHDRTDRLQMETPGLCA